MAKRMFDKISTLSGGEKNRLLLAKKLINPGNLLVLDEPTNDLDLPTLAVLEQFLIDFAGCVLLVSHDRYFMDKLVDHLFIFEGDGVIRDYPGNYTQFRILEKSKQSYAAVSSDITTHAVPVKEAAAKITTEKKPIEKASAEKMTYKEKLELDTLTKSMPDLEKKKAALLEQLNATNLDYTLITSISEELSNINQALELAEIRWLELSEKAV